MLQTQPLLLGVRLDHVPEFGPLHEGEAGVREWFEVAIPFAAGFMEVIEFLRSRLPGYPRLMVPDLTPEAPRVYADGFWDMSYPWMAAARRVRLQLLNEPGFIRSGLDLPDDGAQLQRAVKDLLEMLQASAAWRRFVVAHEALQETDWTEAREVRKAYRGAVAEERLDSIAGENGMRAQNMRRAELARVKESAGENLREYYEAFDEVDELINALAALLSYRIAVGDIDELPLGVADWGPESELRQLRFQARNDNMRHPFEMVRLQSAVPALSGLVLLHGLTLYLDDERIVADGRLLTGSAELSAAGPGLGSG